LKTKYIKNKTNNMVPIKTPLLTVDIIIRYQEGIVLVERKNPPYGWALPGGFVEVGESLEDAAIREAKEETSLDIQLIEQFHAYSDPRRDPRFHTASVVFLASANGILCGRDDAREAEVFSEETLPFDLVFDHKEIIADYFNYRRSGKMPLSNSF
jgi:8-oxo-dGTP diphosphatase